jgi:hypothetical protein
MWRVQAVPADLAVFDENTTKGKMGFVTFRINRKDMKGKVLTQYLEAVVMLPASMQQRVTSCKLLVRMMLRRKLMSMQEELFPALAVLEHPEDDASEESGDHA